LGVRNSQEQTRQEPSKDVFPKSPKIFSSRWSRWGGFDGFAASNDFGACGFIEYA
jgi:hypothetical protein